jgi:hypothetical protein
MCFSAEADFVSGALISAVGVATLTKVEQPRELALGALPLAFGVHQLVEGFVWLGLDGRGSESAGDIAMHAYLAFAWVLLPFLVPLAITLVEPDRGRRRAMVPFVVLGAAVGLYLLWSMVDQGVTAHIDGHTIVYGGAGNFGNTATALYVIATCIPPLLSTHRGIRWFGALDLVAVGVIAWVQSDGLTSLWCLWAAIVSVLIYLQFVMWRRADAGDERAPTLAVETGPSG